MQVVAADVCASRIFTSADGAGCGSADCRHSENNCKAAHDRLRIARVSGHDSAIFGPAESESAIATPPLRRRERYAVMM